MPSQLTEWQGAIQAALLKLATDILAILPNIIAAVVVLFIGIFLASLLGRLCKRVVDFTRVDTFLQKTVGLGKLKERGMDVNAAALVGWLIKWFFIIVTFIAVADILKLQQLTGFFETVAQYVPKVVTTVLILLAGFILGGGLRDLVIRSVKASTLPDSSAGILGTFARWAVIIFAFMAALTQLGIADDLIRILFTGLVAMLALAGGLSFGLGGQRHAGDWLEKLKKEMKH